MRLHRYLFPVINITGGTTADTGLALFLFSASIAKKEMMNTLDLEIIISDQRCQSNSIFLSIGIVVKKEVGTPLSA